MIARVKIAPVERWAKCHGHHFNASRQVHALEGLEVEIDTSTMDVRNDWHDAPTRFWRLTEQSARKFDETQGYLSRDYNYGHLIVCEHMLEMD